MNELETWLNSDKNNRILFADFLKEYSLKCYKNGYKAGQEFLEIFIEKNELNWNKEFISYLASTSFNLFLEGGKASSMWVRTYNCFSNKNVC